MTLPWPPSLATTSTTWTTATRNNGRGSSQRQRIRAQTRLGRELHPGHWRGEKQLRCGDLFCCDK